MSKAQYEEFVYATNVEKSGKANSYIRALELLSQMLGISAFGFDDCIDIWHVTSIERLDELYNLVLKEKQRGSTSPWVKSDIPSSYLASGYCSAAIRSFQNYLLSLKQEQQLFEVYKNHIGNAKLLIEKLDVEPSLSFSSFGDISEQEGKEVLRKTKVRLNQNVFRKLILDIYGNTCCITGLNIPQLNIASYIIPWSENSKSRLDPTKGLCLSATYDAAFDKKLISLDDKYKIIVSKQIKNLYKNEIVNLYFTSIEGKQISLPELYKPKKSYLAKHREGGIF